MSTTSSRRASPAPTGSSGSSTSGGVPSSQQQQQQQQQQQPPPQPKQFFPLFTLVRVLGVGRPMTNSNTAATANPLNTAAAAAVTAGALETSLNTAPDTDPDQHSQQSQQRGRGRSTSLLFATAGGDPVALVPQPTVVTAAAAGCVGHAFLALYSTNDQLILRYAGGSGFPTVRIVPWFKDAAKRVTTLIFNPTAEWLVCVCADTSIYLVPALALLLGGAQQHSSGVGGGAGGSGTGGVDRDSAADAADEFDVSRLPSAPNGAPEKAGGWLGRQLPSLMTYALDQTVSSNAAATDSTELGSGSDITLVYSPPRSFRATATITCCAWWRTWGGLDICVVGNNAGALTFYDLRLKTEVYTVRLKSEIKTIDLVEDAVQSFRYLLVETATSGYWNVRNYYLHIFYTNFFHASSCCWSDKTKSTTSLTRC